VHIPRSCSQKSLPITRVVHRSLAEVPCCCFSTYKAVFRRHQCHHCTGEARVEYLSSPLCSFFSLVSLLIPHPYTWYRTPPLRSASYPSASVFSYPSVSSVLGVSLPPLPWTHITSSTVISSPSASYHYTPLPLLSILAILPTTQPPYRKHTNIPCGTQLFSAIQQHPQPLLRTLVRHLYGVHRRSGVERGLDGKDLASAYVLHPLGWLS